MSRARTSALLPLLTLLAAAACARPEPVAGAGNSAASPATAGATGAADTTTPSPAPPMPSEPPTTSPLAGNRELATFGNGCFWCSEAVLEQLDGVLDVTSGYAGGEVDAPSYEQVCTGRTGHAEVVQVTFDPARIRFDQLLDWFFKSHDPTTLNRQGADVGTQYRSVVFYHSEAQHQAALAAIARWQQKLAEPIVTEVTPAPKFWSAEDHHQDYFRTHPSQGYCRAVIAPKLKQLGLDAK